MFAKIKSRSESQITYQKGTMVSHGTPPNPYTYDFTKQIKGIVTINYLVMYIKKNNNTNEYVQIMIKNQIIRIDKINNKRIMLNDLLN